MSNITRVSFALVTALFSLGAAADPAELRDLAHEYYHWRDTAYPVATSPQGDHRFDNRLADYSMSEVLKRREHVTELLTRVNALATDGWSKDDRIDRILFQSQLEGVDFFGRRLNPEESDPQLYVNECSNAIFSLLQKEYAPHRTRALAATARLEQMPALLRRRGESESSVKLYGSRSKPRGRRSLRPASRHSRRSLGRRAQAAREARDGALKSLPSSRIGSLPTKPECRTGSRWAKRNTTIC
jgi:hypothetical protein